jgi:predicted transcriptional regulator of viral defense system
MRQRSGDMGYDTSLAKRIEREVKQKKFNTFTAKDFIELGNIKTINKNLERMEKNNEIRRIIPGVYDIPVYSTLLQEYGAPSINEVAQALARAHNWKLSPSGPSALNYLGLSTQVPANYQYVSSGPYKTYTIGNSELRLNHTNNRLIYDTSKDTAILIQAIKALGRGNITKTHQDKLRETYDEAAINRILEESKHSAAWIYEAIREIFAA